MKFDVYVLSLELANRLNIKRGSAIVASQHQQEKDTLVYFEGNIYDCESMRTFEDKCLYAAGRAIKRYPTVAKANIPAAELISVGIFDYQIKRFLPNPERVHELKIWQS